jgi:predicted transcriptional regulator
MPSSPRRSSFPGLGGPAGRRRELIEELVRARRESELSQTEIAARMGTSQSAVARLEGGDLDARLSTVERYAAALGRSVEWQVRPSEESS